MNKGNSIGEFHQTVGGYIIEENQEVQKQEENQIIRNRCREERLFYTYPTPSFKV